MTNTINNLTNTQINILHSLAFLKFSSVEDLHLGLNHPADFHRALISLKREGFIHEAFSTVALTAWGNSLQANLYHGGL